LALTFHQYKIFATSDVLAELLQRGQPENKRREQKQLIKQRKKNGCKNSLKKEKMNEKQNGNKK
jgi:hypothetical protein